MRSRPTLLLLALALLPEPAWSFQCKVEEALCIQPLRRPGQVATYSIRTPPPGSPVDRAALAAAARRAFERWTSQHCTSLRFEERPESEGTNPIALLTTWPGRSRTAGLTHFDYHPNSGEISAVSISINAEHYAVHAGSEPCPESSPDGRPVIDLEAVLLHEIGHSIGLDHPCEYPGEELVMRSEGMDHPDCPKESCDLLLQSGTFEDTVLWPSLRGCGDTYRELLADDVEAVCSLYPREGEASACTVLPAQLDPYVDNQAFGCRAAPRSAGALWVSLLGALALLRRRRAVC